MRPAMSPKRRFMTAFFGGTPDRVPVGNVVSAMTVDLMQVANAWFPAAHLDADVMARLAATGFDILGYDTITPVFSVVQEAAALGCAIEWGGPTQMPAVTSHPFAATDDFTLPDGWMQHPAIQTVLDALAQLRAQYGDRAVIVGKAMGPWTLSYHLMGMDTFLMQTILDPARVHACLRALQEVAITFGRAQMQAGADIICLADHPTGDVISAQMYHDFVLERHQHIVGEMNAPVVLHCCGDNTDRLHHFAAIGVDCYHFESKIAVADAVREAKGSMTLIGNINNPEVLLNGTPEQVAADCRAVIAGGVPILAPECAVPLTTPLLNLQTLVRVAEEGL